MSRTVKLQQVIKSLWNLLESDYSKIIHMTVQKKDGTIRSFQAHLNVKKYLKGGSAPYDFKAKGLLPVGDVELMKRLSQGITIDKEGKEIKTPYRSINLKGLIDFTIEGVTFEVEENVHLKTGNRGKNNTAAEILS